MNILSYNFLVKITPRLSTMQPKKSDIHRSFLCQDLIDQLDHRNHLLSLPKAISLNASEDNFRSLSAANGRPGKPIRLIVRLLILNQLEDLSNARVAKAWVQHLYFQAIRGQLRFTRKPPYDPSETTYFHRRIGEDGIRKSFEAFVTLHGGKAKEPEVVLDCAVQEKNISFPTNTKLLSKNAARCHNKAKLEGVKLRRSYQRQIISLVPTIHFKSNTRRDESHRAPKRLRTIADILVRELNRKLSPESRTISQPAVDLYDRTQCQQRSDKGNICSLHEPGASCISEGKAHNKYDLNAKASVTVTKISGTSLTHCPFSTIPSIGTRCLLSSLELKAS